MLYGSNAFLRSFEACRGTLQLGATFFATATARGHNAAYYHTTEGPLSTCMINVRGHAHKRQDVYLHSRVPLPEMTLPLPSDVGLGPLREFQTFSKPCGR